MQNSMRADISQNKVQITEKTLAGRAADLRSSMIVTPDSSIYLSRDGVVLKRRNYTLNIARVTLVLLNCHTTGAYIRYFLKLR